LDDRPNLPLFPPRLHQLSCLPLFAAPFRNQFPNVFALHLGQPVSHHGLKNSPIRFVLSVKPNELGSKQKKFLEGRRSIDEITSFFQSPEVKLRGSSFRFFKRKSISECSRSTPPSSLPQNHPPPQSRKTHHQPPLNSQVNPRLTHTGHHPSGHPLIVCFAFSNTEGLFRGGLLSLSDGLRDLSGLPRTIFPSSAAVVRTSAFQHNSPSPVPCNARESPDSVSSVVFASPSKGTAAQRSSVESGSGGF